MGRTGNWNAAIREFEGLIREPRKENSPLVSGVSRAISALRGLLYTGGGADQAGAGIWLTNLADEST